MTNWICYENLNIFLAFCISLYITGSFWLIKSCGDVIELSDEEVMAQISGWVLLFGVLSEFLGFFIVFRVLAIHWVFEILLSLLLNFATDTTMIFLYMMFFVSKERRKNFYKNDDDENDSNV